MIALDLCSHSAIQGTARPVHYHVLLDEAGLTENQLYTLIYEQCYQYIRSTTPVSLRMSSPSLFRVPNHANGGANQLLTDPAVYYAHLASNRARAHEDVPASSGPQSGQGFKPSSTSSETHNVDFKPLLKLKTYENDEDSRAIVKSMWYI